MISPDDGRYSWTRQQMLTEIDRLDIEVKSLSKYKRLYLKQRKKYKKLSKVVFNVIHNF